MGSQGKCAAVSGFCECMYRMHENPACTQLAWELGMSFLCPGRAFSWVRCVLPAMMCNAQKGRLRLDEDAGHSAMAVLSVAAARACCSQMASATVAATSD